MNPAPVRVLIVVGGYVGMYTALRLQRKLLTQWVPARLHARRGTHPGGRLSGWELVALSWSGTRGVITMRSASAVIRCTRRAAGLGEGRWCLRGG